MFCLQKKVSKIPEYSAFQKISQLGVWGELSVEEKETKQHVEFNLKLLISIMIFFLNSEISVAEKNDGEDK